MTAKDSLSARELYEDRQARWLVPYAVCERDSEGRGVSEPDHDYRTCFQRDRDRIVHCSAFRRLDFKTQVFVPHERDHFRTRLTHTLEVAQIARTLGRALRLNEDLIEAVALAHDLGHPPFGHGGEAVLAELMTAHGDFEHNRQSLRVVDYLEHPYPQFRGLNLTRVVRECIARHETRYDTSVCRDFDDNLQAPLEGQVVDLADEMAYTSADLEDALAAGCIRVGQLATLGLWRRAWSLAEQDTPGAREIHKRIRACKAVLEIMASDTLVATSERIEALGPDSVGAIRQAERKCVDFGEQIAIEVLQLQRFLLDNVYLAGDSARRDGETRQMIVDLFGRYVSRSALLPDRYRRRAEADGLHRVVCDYIAGMTDRFCKAEHARVCGR
ncbi:MAG: deoxyguanosinetriphosphate triphosphohydrolase [Phycisphaerae bacterium]|jgi:dGTPase|nr:deoxyguanosinetriphosphate triphosphohydrolase [Phycisphaerae bacterium]